METDNLTMSFPKNSPNGNLAEAKGPTFDELKNAKASEFLKELKLSSYKFSYDSPTKPRPDALYLNPQQLDLNKDKKMALAFDKNSKMHLTQMKTLNSDANSVHSP